MAQQWMRNDAVESKDSLAVSSGEAGDFLYCSRYPALEVVVTVLI